MVIEVNKDIDKYQESVVLGLSAKQLLFSAASLICGGGLVLLLFPHIGLTASAYVAIPVAAPIALGGFYTYNGMSFYDVVKRKLYFISANRTLVYSSTECEQAIREYVSETAGKEKVQRLVLLQGILRKKQALSKEAGNTDKGNHEGFEAVKKKTRKLVIGCIVTVILAAAGAIAYQYTR